MTPTPIDPDTRLQRLCAVLDDIAREWAQWDFMDEYIQLRLGDPSGSPAEHMRLAKAALGRVR